MKIYNLFSILLFLVGIILLFDKTGNITGAVIGTNALIITNPLLGLLFIISSIFLFVNGSTLEEVVQKHNWKKYPITKDSIIQDIEQGYLSAKEESHKTPVQERIERMVTKGKLIKEELQNKYNSYKEQFYEGHATQGGRIIDVESHITRKGENKGKLIHFGQPANARYLWVVDEDGNFIIANRQTFLHEMAQMNPKKIDYTHRLHKLPHATLSKGKRIYGSGEVVVEGGLVKSYNSASGHYVELRDIESFNNQGKEVFNYFIKKVGWKEVKKGAKYEIKS